MSSSDWAKGGLLEVESHISAYCFTLNESLVLMSGDGGDEGWRCIQSNDRLTSTASFLPSGPNITYFIALFSSYSVDLSERQMALPPNQLFSLFKNKKILTKL